MKFHYELEKKDVVAGKTVQDEKGNDLMIGYLALHGDRSLRMITCLEGRS